MDSIKQDDHLRYFVIYGALLVITHSVSHLLVHPSNVDGKLTNGQLAVNRHRYSNKIVGILHACFLSFAAIRCGLTRGFDLQAEEILATPPLEHFAVGCMMVYLVYDTIYFYWRFYILQPSLGVKEKWNAAEHTGALVHHYLGLLSWGFIYSGTGGVYWAQYIHLAEISTPILNLRWIMMKEGVRDGIKVVSVVFLVVFFLTRIPTTVVLLYHMWRSVDKWPSKTIAYFQFIVTFSFLVVNLIWFSGGIKMAIRAMSRKSKKKE
mmetsp:Transcript_45672/g.67401  ORF Transcript_45672/g.67401 Transcript_45672/m.67401 type:complete len:264 (-) Transcript_45672:31-822(-)